MSPTDQPQTHTREQILASLAANGCTKIGRNRWKDATRYFSIKGRGETCLLVAERIFPAKDANEAMREALRPMYYEWLARQASAA